MAQWKDAICQIAVIAPGCTRCGTIQLEGWPEPRPVAIGTGYPVAPNLIITARHVLFEDDAEVNEAEPETNNVEIYVSWRGHSWQQAGAVVYLSPIQHDVVLIRIAIPSAIESRPPLLKRFPKQEEVWSSRGYARFHKAGPVGLREPLEAGGPTVEPDSVQAYLDFGFDQDKHPKKWEEWKGISGAPVFIDERLAAILLSGKDPALSVLRGTSLRYLLKQDERFRNMVEQARIPPQRRLLSDRLYRHKLTQYLETRGRLNTAIALGSGLEEGETLALDELLAKDPAELVNLCCDASLWYDGNQTDIKVLLDTALPAVVPDADDLARLHSSRLGEGVAIVRVAAGIELTAEILMAALDRRECRHRPRRSHTDFPGGTYQLAEEAEMGFSDDDVGTPKKVVQPCVQKAVGLASELKQRLNGKEISPSIAERMPVMQAYLVHRFGRRTVGGGSERENASRWLQDEINNKVEPKTYYMIINRDHLRHGGDALAKELEDFKAEFPAVVFLELDEANQPSDETTYHNYNALIPPRKR